MPTKPSKSETGIDASMKVGELLEQYPELEDLLISMAAPFKKLRNPVLRRSVAQVASLGQAAAVAGIRATDLVNLLRTAVGQAPVQSTEAPDRTSYFQPEPDWFDEELIEASIDERKDTNPNLMPLVGLFDTATHLPTGRIVELITTFLPAPGIDIMKQRGFKVWSIEEETDLIRSYFQKQ
jgi:hypothetical protein